MTAAPPEAPTQAEHITVEEHERRMAEFRAKVRTEAMEMARANDLCAVVEQTLKKVGIDNENRFITVVITSETRRVLKVPADLIFGLDEAALAKVVNQYINGGLPNPVSWRSVEQISLTSTNVGAPAVKVVEEPDAVYENRFTSSEGRVKHLIQRTDNPNGRRDGLSDEALCGAVTKRWDRWPSHSSRDEHRTCSNCETRYAKAMSS